MKKLMIWVFVLLIGTYGVGYFSLGAGGVARFLEKMQATTQKGDAQGLCDLLADDMRVDITDHTAELDPRLGSGKINGGKAVLCSHLQATVAPMAPGVTIQITREGLKIERQALLHPWTAQVSYNEKQSLMLNVNGRSGAIKTESDDKLQLVMTFTGVKIKRLESEAWLQ